MNLLVLLRTTDPGSTRGRMLVQPLDDSPAAVQFVWEWVESLKAPPTAKMRATIDYLVAMHDLAQSAKG